VIERKKDSWNDGKVPAVIFSARWREGNKPRMPRSKIPNPISKIKKFLKKKKKVKITIRVEAYFLIALVLNEAKVSDYRIARNAV